MSEYSFHARHKKEITPTTSSHQDLSLLGSTKTIILQQYDHLVNLKRSDEKVKYLSETQEKLSREITTTFTVLQQAKDSEQIHQLNLKMSHLTTLHKQLKDEYDERLKTELNIVYRNWPEIYDKIIEGVERETLEHVLTMYDKYQNGKINANDAVTTGMDYMTNKYHLPTDFFNKNAVEQFNKDLTKPNR
jgi:hypothetical protein